MKLVRDTKEIENALNAASRELKERRDPNYFFPLAYLYTSRMSADFSSRLSKTEPSVAVIYDKFILCFANKYFIQVEKYLRGDLVDEPWKTTFEKSRNADDAGQIINMGLMAHIHYDFPHSIYETLASIDAKDDQRKSSFAKAYKESIHVPIEGISMMVPAVFCELEKQGSNYGFRYGDIYRKVPRPLLAIYLHFIFRIIRREAWWHSQHLLSGSLTDEFLLKLTLRRIERLSKSASIRHFYWLVLKEAPSIIKLSFLSFQTALKAAA